MKISAITEGILPTSDQDWCLQAAHSNKKKEEQCNDT